MTEWLSLRDAARRLPVSEATLLRQLREGKEAADARFGEGNWRLRPLITRTIYQVSEAWVAAQERANRET